MEANYVEVIKFLLKFPENCHVRDEIAKNDVNHKAGLPQVRGSVINQYVS
jgi:hypothetical protein